MEDKLMQLQRYLKENSDMKTRFIASRNDEDPVASFCELAGECGFELTPGELFAIGEEYTSNLLKSVNGGATYPFDGWDDWYEDFFAALIWGR